MFRKCLKNTVKTTQSAIRKEDGLTLLEAAIGLIIIGLITLPLIHSYKTTLIQESRDRTRGSMANIKDAINQYHAAGNFVYPCPASISLQEGGVRFGIAGLGSANDCQLADLKLCTNPTWSTTEGICKTDDTTDAVIIGAVPFSNLKMQQEKALDFWGNKIIYAVTFEQTNLATFTGNIGTIRVKAVDNPEAIQDQIENGTSASSNSSNDGIPNEKTSSVDFFLFSTGATGIGGYTKNGILIQACGDATTGFEHENCDFDDVFFYDKNPTDDAASAYSEVPGLNFFDDMTRAQLSIPEPMWFQHPDNGTYTEDYLLTLSTRIGIGPDPITDPLATIEVQGNIRTNGMLKSDEMCNKFGNECFDPELITGDLDVMKCNPAGDTMFGDQAVMQIARNQVHCNSTVDTSNNAFDGVALHVDTSIISGSTATDSVNGHCQAGWMVSGFDSNGEIICTNPP